VIHRERLTASIDGDFVVFLIGMRLSQPFAVRAGAYESVYVNMPAFGLGRAGKLEPATGRKHSAPDRLGRGK